MAPQVAQILEAISHDTSLLLSSIVDVHAEGNSNLKPDNEFHRVGEIDHMQFPHMQQAAVNEKVISSDVILGVISTVPPIKGHLSYLEKSE